MLYFIKKITKILLILMLSLILLIPALIPTVKVSGNSMFPTLKNGDVAIILPKITYRKGDICCFEKNGVLYVKRIAGTEGDKIAVYKDNTVDINREINYNRYNNIIIKAETVAKNCVYVMGDNIHNSYDSRSQSFDNVCTSSIIGKVAAVIRNDELVFFH